IYIYICSFRRLLTSNGPVGRAIVGSGPSRLCVFIGVDRPTSTTTVEPVPLPPLVASLCRRGIVCDRPLIDATTASPPRHGLGLLCPKSRYGSIHGRNWILESRCIPHKISIIPLQIKESGPLAGEGN
ncbi:unnamed protein product, partial [Musa acuminata var. zebrina]